ncbi:peptidylprolyl isomerase fpr3 [Exserohilum turcicum]
MASAVPVGVYGRRIPAGGIPIVAALDQSTTFRITMAAIDPDAEPQFDEDHKHARATLKLIRMPEDYDMDDDEDDEDYEEGDIEAIAARLRAAGALPELDSDMSDDDSEDEKNGGPSDPAKSKKAKQAALTKKMQEELEADDMEIDGMTNGAKGKAKGKAKATEDDLSDEDDEDDDDDDEDDEPEELVLCTLDPEKHYQQPLDITVRQGEEVYLCVNGTHDVYVTGNYLAFPDEDDSEDDEDDGLDELGYDLSPDEDELDDIDESEDDELDGMADPRITEVDSDEEEVPKLVDAGKKNKKRAAEPEDDATLDDMISKTNGDAKLSKKQAKKLKKNDGQAAAGAAQPEKKAEKGPTGSPKVDAPKPEAKKEAAKGPRNVSGVTVDDKKEGKGRAAKKGDRVEMRYIGKLKNGKVFDSNKKGKPFSFKLGVGEVIKGWDVGVAGMAPGGERRLTIPAALAYGKRGAPPDIPPNSDLIFDIKCISVS